MKDSVPLIFKPSGMPGLIFPCEALRLRAVFRNSASDGWPRSRRCCETQDARKYRRPVCRAGAQRFSQNKKIPINPTNHITSYIIVRTTSYEQNVPAGTLVQIFVVFRAEHASRMHERDARAYIDSRDPPLFTVTVSFRPPPSASPSARTLLPRVRYRAGAAAQSSALDRSAFLATAPATLRCAEWQTVQ